MYLSNSWFLALVIHKSGCSTVETTPAYPPSWSIAFGESVLSVQHARENVSFHRYIVGEFNCRPMYSVLLLKFTSWSQPFLWRWSSVCGETSWRWSSVCGETSSVLLSRFSVDSGTLLRMSHYCAVVSEGVSNSMKFPILNISWKFEILLRHYDDAHVHSHSDIIPNHDLSDSKYLD